MEPNKAMLEKRQRMARLISWSDGLFRTTHYIDMLLRSENAEIKSLPAQSHVMNHVVRSATQAMPTTNDIQTLVVFDGATEIVVTDQMQWRTTIEQESPNHAKIPIVRFSTFSGSAWDHAAMLRPYHMSKKAVLFVTTERSRAHKHIEIFIGPLKEFADFFIMPDDEDSTLDKLLQI